MRFLPFVFCASFALTVAAALWPVLGGEYAYGQWVVGSISLQAENKAVDYQALLVAVAVFVALSWSLHRLVGRLGRTLEPQTSLDPLLGLALLPLALWLGTALVRNTPPGFPYAWALAAVAIIVFGAWRWGTSMRVDGDALTELGQGVLCSLLLSLFGGIGALLLVFHASGHVFPGSPRDAEVVVTIALIANALVVGYLFAHSSHQSLLQRDLQRWLVTLQFPLPLLGLVLLPAQIAYRGAFEPYVWPWQLLLVLVVYSLMAWRRLVRRLRQTAVADLSVQAALDPWALVMLAVFMTAPWTTFELLSASGYATFFSDSYHLGEQILPWQQWVDFHKIPYVDFAPVHGLMPILTGALSQFFYDGTLANLNSSFSILVAIASAATVCLACRVSGTVLGLALCFLLAPFDRLLFLAPMLLLLADAKLAARPGPWLGAWVLATTFLLGYNAAVGSAFAGGTAPFALLVLIRVCKAGWRARRNLVISGAAAVALIAFAPHGREVFEGFVTFVAENGATNTVGHGVPLARGFGLAGNPSDGVLSSRVLFDLLRLSWIVVALYALQCGLLDWRASRRGGNATAAPLLPFAISLTLLLLSAWSMGRIDAESASRPGMVSFLAAGTLLPILHIARSGFPPPWAQATFALIIGMFAAMHGLQDRLLPVPLTLRGFVRVEVPATMERIDGADFGGSRLGTLYVPPNRRAEIVDFADALKQVLAPGQTYFDFTNRQAFYFYLGLPVPALYSATFNVMNESQQRRILHQLVVDAPAAVFVAPALEGDGINASLRSFYLYRHFVRSYRPVKRGPYTFLVNATSPAFPGEPNVQEESALLDQAFAHRDLQLIPATWGRSWPTLRDKARPLGELVPEKSESPSKAVCLPTPEGKNSPLELLGRYQLPSPENVAERADLLEIQLRAGTTMPDSLLLRFSTAPDGAVHTAAMGVRGRTLIVPISAYPSWLRSPDIRTIELCAPPREAPTRDLIAGVSAWKIPDLLP